MWYGDLLGGKISGLQHGSQLKPVSVVLILLSSTIRTVALAVFVVWLALTRESDHTLHSLVLSAVTVCFRDIYTVK